MLVLVMIIHGKTVYVFRPILSGEGNTFCLISLVGVWRICTGRFFFSLLYGLSEIGQGDQCFGY